MVQQQIQNLTQQVTSQTNSLNQGFNLANSVITSIGNVTNQIPNAASAANLANISQSLDSANSAATTIGNITNQIPNAASVANISQSLDLAKSTAASIGSISNALNLASDIGIQSTALTDALNILQQSNSSINSSTQMLGLSQNVTGQLQSALDNVEAVQQKLDNLKLPEGISETDFNALTQEQKDNFKKAKEQNAQRLAEDANKKQADLKQQAKAKADEVKQQISKTTKDLVSQIEDIRLALDKAAFGQSTDTGSHDYNVEPIIDAIMSLIPLLLVVLPAVTITPPPILYQLQTQLMKLQQLGAPKIDSAELKKQIPKGTPPLSPALMVALHGIGIDVQTLIATIPMLYVQLIFSMLKCIMDMFMQITAVIGVPSIIPFPCTLIPTAISGIPTVLQFMQNFPGKMTSAVEAVARKKLAEVILNGCPTSPVPLSYAKDPSKANEDSSKPESTADKAKSPTDEKQEQHSCGGTPNNNDDKSQDDKSQDSQDNKSQDEEKYNLMDLTTDFDSAFKNLSDIVSKGSSLAQQVQNLIGGGSSSFPTAVDQFQSIKNSAQSMPI